MIDILLSAIFPPKCPYCKTILSYGMSECAVCREQFPDYPRTEHIPSGEMCVSPFTYDSRVRQAIIDYKFHGRKFNSESFAKILAHTVDGVYGDSDFETVTSVPLSKARQNERGYNQSELIAVKTAKILGKRYERLLVKTKNNREQHGLNAEERIKNVVGVYSVTNRQKIIGKSILIVDDVITTGYTLSECCCTLKKGGAAKVLCAAVAAGGQSHLENKL